jgi:hypothetical protein
MEAMIGASLDAYHRIADRAGRPSGELVVRTFPGWLARTCG